MTNRLGEFRHVWCIDFEFSAPSGERPTPVCMVAREFHTGRLVRLSMDELAHDSPFPVGPDTLFVAYYASAELGCYLSLGWQLPERVLDLFTEFRCLANGLPVPCGNGLLGALSYFGLSGIDAAEKDDMRQLAMRGGPYTSDEMRALLDYCQSDVDALVKLLGVMLPRIDLPRALLRGRYMRAAARMEHTGTPIDVGALGQMVNNWRLIQNSITTEVDSTFGCYVPTGQKKINPESQLGAAILAHAAEYEIDPTQLAEAADELWKAERESHREFEAAKSKARKQTGLTVNRIRRWEHLGKDHSTWPDLDVTARSVAGEYPELGIGPGHNDDGFDNSEYGDRLWNILREGKRAAKPKHDGELLDAAARLVADNPDSLGVYSQPLSFSAERFADYLVDADIPWPRLGSGQLALDDDTFRQMAKAYPQIAPLRELRFTLSQMRLSDLAVGCDDRNRCLLSAFRSTTGRNQPSNSKFIFGPSAWLRSLIKPAPGMAVAYVDYSQQEFGIAAKLSGDVDMMGAYASGDPYLTFAKQAGAVPDDATKQSHKRERDQFKVCALAVQYGMGAESLAQSLGQSEAFAAELLRLHKRTYPAFWKWSQAAVDHAMLKGYLWTVFGWRVHVSGKANPRSLANFPVQGNGAEMLRLACCLATERGIRVCAPVHDALLVEGPTDEIEAVVAETQQAMREASEAVLDGFPLRTDAEIVRYPDRYMDSRGKKMWETVTGILGRIESVKERSYMADVGFSRTATYDRPGRPYLTEVRP